MWMVWQLAAGPCCLNARLLADCLARLPIGKAARNFHGCLAGIPRIRKEYPGLYMSPCARRARSRSGSKPGPRGRTTMKVGWRSMLRLACGRGCIHGLRAFRSMVHGFATLEWLAVLVCAGLRRSFANWYPLCGWITEKINWSTIMEVLKVLNWVFDFYSNCACCRVAFWDSRPRITGLMKILLGIGLPLLIAKSGDFSAQSDSSLSGLPFYAWS